MPLIPKRGAVTGRRPDNLQTCRLTQRLRLLSAAIASHQQQRYPLRHLPGTFILSNHGAQRLLAVSHHQDKVGICYMASTITR
ncbi:hypothetical protein [Izhakiella capsodis]|uniref:hypothetical protein n=1 Tax=Izhakiella capsodis TaxID=1367852 RepID=UPI001E6456E6|nr:hypothetical protein [Izhakiella capsodis]